MRITAAGLISFILYYRTNYRSTAKRQRRYTIGRYPELSAEAARNGIVSNDGSVLVPGAIQLRQWILVAEHPIESESLLMSPCSVTCWTSIWTAKSLLNGDQRHRGIIVAWQKRFSDPSRGRIRLKAVTRNDVEALHNSLKSTPYQANRVPQLASGSSTMQRRSRESGSTRTRCGTSSSFTRRSARAF